MRLTLIRGDDKEGRHTGGDKNVSPLFSTHLRVIMHTHTHKHTDRNTHTETHRHTQIEYIHTPDKNVNSLVFFPLIADLLSKARFQYLSSLQAKYWGKQILTIEMIPSKFSERWKLSLTISLYFNFVLNCFLNISTKIERKNKTVGRFNRLLISMYTSWVMIGRTS